MEASVTRKILLNTTIDPEQTISIVNIQEVTLEPKFRVPLHLHPCPTFGVVTAGAIAFQIEGQAVQHLKAGDAFYEPVNVRVARFDNEGNLPAKFVVHYLLGRGEHETIRMLDK